MNQILLIHQVQRILYLKPIDTANFAMSLAPKSSIMSNPNTAKLKQSFTENKDVKIDIYSKREDEDYF